MDPNILIIDDDDVTRLPLVRRLSNAGYRARGGATAADMWRAFAEEEFDALLLDILLPDANGIDLIPEILETVPDLPIIIITAFGSIERVVEAMQRGAFDFFSKPVEDNRLKVSVKNAVQQYALKRKVTTLEKTRRAGLGELIGGSPAMQVVYHIIETVAPTKAPVLITGESGTGKELVARAIHTLSPRRKNDLVDVNCAAIPKELLESELFGHEKNAFTGAVRRYTGCCERAHQSSLFLDEIGEMEYNLQAKILRFLQEFSFNRVGGEEKIHVDTRILSATNRSPQEAIRRGQLREDLYYRLNVVNIHLPPLRERIEDLPALADHFLKKYSNEHGKSFTAVSPGALRVMQAYRWPGNVRELENGIQQAVLLHTGNTVEIPMLPEAVRSAEAQTSRDGIKDGVPPPPAAIPGPPATPSGDRIIPLMDLEKTAIEQALRITHGNIAQAAVGLKLSQATLYRKLRDYDFNIKDFK
ncbi:MAG: sigma-54-dependent transcriptional regulator [bacterium]